MTSCPYSDEELEQWDSVSNPMGDACFDCYDCDCEHWSGTCNINDCQRLADGECSEPKFEEAYIREEVVADDKNEHSTKDS